MFLFESATMRLQHMWHACAYNTSNKVKNYRVYCLENCTALFTLIEQTCGETLERINYSLQVNNLTLLLGRVLLENSFVSSLVKFLVQHQKTIYKKQLMTCKELLYHLFLILSIVSHLVTLWSTSSTVDVFLATFSFTNIIPAELRPDLHRLKKATRSPANKCLTIPE